MKPKVLYLGVFKDGTGYAKSGIETAIAMKRAGVDVVCRAISLSGGNEDVPPEMQELLDKPYNPKEITHTIQHYLPHMAAFSERTKNIVLFAYENSNFDAIGWKWTLDLADKTVVFSEHNLQMCRDSRVENAVVIPQAVDTERYSRNYPPNNIPKKGRYVFYGIGDWSARKNYETLVRAYLDEFTYLDDVLLVLKTYVSGSNADNSRNKILQDINNIKALMRKGKEHIWPEIILITDRMTDEQIYGLHQECDCFVTVEKGAGWCLPAFDAAGFGNKIVAINDGGHVDFLDKFLKSGKVYYISTTEENCYGMTADICPYPNLNTGRERWIVPDYNAIKECLRTAYNHHLEKQTNAETLAEYSYTVIGERWKQLIESL